MTEDSRPSAAQIGQRDRLREGWQDAKTGELFRGVRVRSSHTVIDVGCGDGGFIGFCAGQGAEVLCIDRDEVKLARTEARVKASPARAYRAILSDCDPIPLEDGVGDLVICTEVLEHVPDPVKFLDELIRVAKPGAQLLISVPDERSEQFVSATAPPQYFEVPNHIRIFSAQAFEKLVLDSGLEIENHHFRGCFWSMFWPLSWMTCEPGPGKGLPVDNEHPIVDHWVRLWEQVQQHPQGHKIRDALNQLLPKSQTIVARKSK
jgi:ubiquinone/menaquinone biosynthesis C-methylase UbiE